jgi:hypothetical protein
MKLTAHPPIPGVTEARIKRNDVVFDGGVQSIETVECELATRINAITYAAALRDHGIAESMKVVEILKYSPDRDNDVEKGEVCFSIYKSDQVLGLHPVKPYHRCAHVGHMAVDGLYVYVSFKHHRFEITVYAALPNWANKQYRYLFGSNVENYDLPKLFALLAEYQIDEKFLDISVRDTTVFRNEMITFFYKALA